MCAVLVPPQHAKWTDPPNKKPGATARLDCYLLPFVPLKPELNPSRNTQVVLHLPAHAWEFTEVRHEIVHFTYRRRLRCLLAAMSRPPPGAIANEFLDPARLNPVPPVVCARPKRPSANGVTRWYVGK